MSQRVNRILIVVLFTAAGGLSLLAAAEEAVTAGVIVRPVMEYKSNNVRDPFKTYFVKEEFIEVPQVAVDLPKPALNLSKFEVQGIIWGVKTPQAIINNKVVTIGDFIEGAEIIGIEKKGVTLNFDGAIFDLNAPGQKPSTKKQTKEV